MRDEIGTSSGHKDTYLEYSYKFHPFGRVASRVSSMVHDLTSHGKLATFTVPGMNPLLVSGP